MSPRNRRGRDNPPVVPYILGAVFLIIAAALSLKGYLSSPHPPKATPAATAVSGSASPSKTSAASSKPSGSPSSASSPSSSAASSAYTTVTMTQADMHRGTLILVNGKNPYIFNGNEDFVKFADYQKTGFKIGSNELQLSSKAAQPMADLLANFYAFSGINAVTVVSTYRTYDKQSELYTAEVAQKGETEAAFWVAKPGTSEHHSGLAVDVAVYYDDGRYFDYDGTGSFAWINEHSYLYGYIVRYQEIKKDITGIYHEPWHFRYLGIPHATEITKLGLCFEEYIDYLRKYTYDNPLEIDTDDGSVYQTYFCSGLTVYVPKGHEYDISGNNVDGFIVTVKIS